MKAIYHFLTGQSAVSKTFEAETKAAADAAAIEFAETKKGVIRVQCDQSRKHIWEKVPKAQQAPDPEALLDQKADLDAAPPTPASAAVATAIGVAGKAVAALIMAAMLLFGMTSQAYSTVGVNPQYGIPVVSSYTLSNNIAIANTNTTATYTTVTTNNGVAVTNTLTAWPGYIAASTTVTNISYVASYVGFHAAVQFTASANQTNGGSVILQLARNIQGGAITNAQGTGLNLDLFATVTNTLPANTATSPTTTCWLLGPVNGQGYFGDGAIPNLYIYSITTPANVTLTNYQVYVNTQ